jgi:hypothetical protein
MEKWGFNARYREVPTLGHEGESDLIPHQLRFLGEWRRPDWPQQISFYERNERHSDAYWVRLAGLDEKKVGDPRGLPLPPESAGYEAQMKAMVKGLEKYTASVDALVDPEKNQITIEARNLKTVHLQLHDRLLDLGKPVTLVVNRKRTTHTVTRDPWAMLDRVRAEGGHARPVWATLDVSVR